MKKDIPCTLFPIPEYAIVPSYNQGERRYGRYHGSVFTKKIAPRGRWVAYIYIDVDWRRVLREEEIGEDEMVERCIDYLNKPPPRKKFQRKHNKPLYGNLSAPVEYKLTEYSDRPCIQVLLTTDVRRCPYFWGEGLSEELTGIPPTTRKRRKIA
jgi:hypothetical protein